MKTIKLNIVQKGSATGNDTSERTIGYLAISKDIENRPSLMSLKEFRSMEYGDYEIACKVIFRHPAIILGTWKDFLRDVCNIAVKEALEQGIIKKHTNTYGLEYYTIVR